MPAVICMYQYVTLKPYNIVALTLESASDKPDFLHLLEVTNTLHIEVTVCYFYFQH